ncbi:hypothetical protein Tco_0621358, partial [Tanacetum coccineum]
QMQVQSKCKLQMGMQMLAANASAKQMLASKCSLQMLAANASAKQMLASKCNLQMLATITSCKWVCKYLL